MIDLNYICGRDNYSCWNCNCQINIYDQTNVEQDGNVILIDKKYGEISSNIKLVCTDCVSKTPTVNSSIKGRLVVISSCMFSEKTTTTKSLINKYSRIKGDFIWVKPDLDTRGVGVVTHNKEEINALSISSSRPDKYLNELLGYNIIAIDEAQFFSNRILYIINNLLMSKDRIIVVNGLKLDYKMNIFGTMHYLLAQADDIISLKSICNICNKIDIATRTRKKINSGSLIEVGGQDLYYTVCQECDND